MKILIAVPVAILTILLSACQSSEKTFMVGTLERDRVELKVESNEPITAIHVQDGQMLSTGDLILEQNPEKVLALVEQQRSLRDQAAARLAELLRGPRPELIEQARALLVSAQLTSSNNKAAYQRAKEVFLRGLSNQSTLDNAETRWKTAVAAETAAAESLSSLLNGTTAEELQQAEAALAASEAVLQSAQISLQRLKVYAPVSGRLEKRLYQIGERPQAGATIAVMLDSARSYARFYVPASQYARMTPGIKLDVRIDGVEKTFRGQLSWVSSDASFTPYFALTEHDRSRLSYLAEVELENADSLPTGLPLEVDFPEGN